VFIDAGESARTADRPEFQRMLAYCLTHREVAYVVVENLSRFARNVGDQANTINALLECGVRVRSIGEPNVDETAAGRLAGNIHGAFNQFYTDQLSEKMRVRSRAAVEAGRWPWQAPTGYLNIDSAKQGGPNIVPDPGSEHLLVKAFEMIATGLHSQSEALKVLTEEGLVNRHGRPFIPQEFQRILRNPIYAGWLSPPSMPDLHVRGLHRPIISDEVFDAVQAVLDGKKPIATPRRKINPDFPLKHFVRCGVCGVPLTACFSRSKNGSLYPYYYCRNPQCRAVSVPRAKIESEFQGMLRTLQLKPEVCSASASIVTEVWRERHANDEKRKSMLILDLDRLKKLKAELLRAKLEHEITQADYEEANARFTLDIAQIEKQVAEMTSSQVEADFRVFADERLRYIEQAWLQASPEQRVSVRNILFPEGLTYKSDSGISNTSKLSLYNVLIGMGCQTGEIGCPPGIRTPITCSRGRCPSR
jgi:site-specific DNA recombinase